MIRLKVRERISHCLWFKYLNIWQVKIVYSLWDVVSCKSKYSNNKTVVLWRHITINNWEQNKALLTLTLLIIRKTKPNIMLFFSLALFFVFCFLFFKSFFDLIICISLRFSGKLLRHLKSRTLRMKTSRQQCMVVCLSLCGFLPPFDLSQKRFDKHKRLLFFKLC